MPTAGYLPRLLVFTSVFYWLYLTCVCVSVCRCTWLYVCVYVLVCVARPTQKSVVKSLAAFLRFAFAPPSDSLPLSFVVLAFSLLCGAQVAVRTAILCHADQHTGTHTRAHWHTIIAHMCVFSFGERFFGLILLACFFLSFSFCAILHVSISLFSSTTHTHTLDTHIHRYTCRQQIDF